MIVPQRTHLLVRQPHPNALQLDSHAYLPELQKVTGKYHVSRLQSVYRD